MLKPRQAFRITLYIRIMDLFLVCQCCSHMNKLCFVCTYVCMCVYMHVRAMTLAIVLYNCENKTATLTGKRKLQSVRGASTRRRKVLGYSIPRRVLGNFQVTDSFCIPYSVTLESTQSPIEKSTKEFP